MSNDYSGVSQVAGPAAQNKFPHVVHPAIVACSLLVVLLGFSLSALAEGWESRGQIAEGYDPKIAVEDNFIHVVYRPAPFGYGLKYERSTDGGDSWETPCTIAAGAGTADPQIEVYEGTVHIVWCYSSSGEVHYRCSLQNGAAGTWENARVLSTTPTRGKEPDIAIGNTSIVIPTYDMVTVVWIGTLGLNTVYNAYSTDLGGTWSAPAAAASASSGTIQAARVAVTRVAGNILVWRQETASASTVSCKYIGSPFGSTVVWSGPQGAFGDLTMAYNSSRVYVTREAPAGPVQRVGVCSMGSHYPNFGPDIDLGNGGQAPQGDASAGYPGTGCVVYRRQYGSGFWGIFVSVGPGKETSIGASCPAPPAPDIAADDCIHMHLVTNLSPGVEDIRYYRYEKPVRYELAAELVGLNKSDAAWGDFDGDGDLDVMLCGETDEGRRSRLFENQNGSLVYHYPDFTGISNNRSSGCLAWGDYDGDGDLDLAMAGETASSRVARVYRNDGGGNMSMDTAQVLTGVGDASLAWGDVDRDGDLDLAVMGWTGSDRVTTLYTNDPLGTLTPDTTTTLLGLSAGSMDWADWDGDGDLDLLLTGSDGASVHALFYENDPVGTLTYDGSHGVYGIWASDTAWGDFDNDGDLDLAHTGERVSGGPRCAVIYENDGTGALTEIGNYLSSYNSSCAWGDYDGDGDLDIVFSGYNGGSELYNNIYRNTGSGFSLVIELTGMDNGSTSFADVDGDGDLDLLTTGGDQGDKFTYLYENNGCPVNTAPTAPTALAGEQTLYGLDLSWNGATDGQTGSDGLYYCLRVGTSPGTDDVVSGTYGTPLLGNVGQATSLHFGVPPATYYWSVRTVDPGFKKSAWSPEQICSPHDINLADHEAGRCVLTVTDQGTLGFMSSAQTEGSGFIYPADGDNLLYVGGLWVGESPTYVANRDYDDDPSREWEVATDPNGHAWMDLNGHSDQDIHVGYTDSSAAVPRDLHVRQVSEAYTNPLTGDFVTIKYAIENRGVASLTDLYVGLFLDVDIDIFTANTGGIDAQRNLAYVAGGADNLHMGACLLQGDSPPPPVANLTLIHNPTYVHPLGYISDQDKYAFLTAADPQHVLEDGSTPEDYGLLVSGGPLTLGPGEVRIVVFAVVGGEGLEDLQFNADLAYLLLHDAPTSVEEPVASPTRLASTARLLPNVPNPFNPSTSIRFELGQAGRARLAVYDVNGRLVRNLADGYRRAGRHAVTWDGRHQGGRVASSGVYFVLFEADAGASSRRVVLMK